MKCATNQITAYNVLHGISDEILALVSQSLFQNFRGLLVFNTNMLNHIWQRYYQSFLVREGRVLIGEGLGLLTEGHPKKWDPWGGSSLIWTVVCACQLRYHIDVVSRILKHKRSRLKSFVSIIELKICFSGLHFFAFCYISWATLCDVAFCDYYESILFFHVSSSGFQISTKLAVIVAQ